jgi:hypothetical protein
VEKHAFISYVDEDAERVNQLQEALEAAGVKVWRDKDNLFPGSDWKTEIRKAITQGSLAFIACFSTASAARDTSYQLKSLFWPSTSAACGRLPNQGSSPCG